MLRMLLVGALCMTLMSCLFTVDAKQSTRDSSWSDHERDQLVVGKTDAQWLRTHIGEPDQISRLEGGTEIWRYENDKRSKSRVGLILLFNINIESDSTETLALTLENDVVTDQWVEYR